MPISPDPSPSIAAHPGRALRSRLGFYVCSCCGHKFFTFVESEKSSNTCCPSPCTGKILTDLRPVYMLQMLEHCVTKSLEPRETQGINEIMGFSDTILDRRQYASLANGNRLLKNLSDAESLQKGSNVLVCCGVIWRNVLTATGKILSSFYTLVKRCSLTERGGKAIASKLLATDGIRLLTVKSGPPSGSWR